MDNQHKLIKGYRDLSQEEIDLLNESKELERQVGEFFLKVAGTKDADIRSATIGRERLITGFMWLNKAIARPENLWVPKKDESAS